MKLTCPDCGKMVPAVDVNIKLGVGKCLACDAVFAIAEQLGVPMARRGGGRDLPVAAPKHWRVEDFGPDLTIGWRWYTHGIWFLVVFAIIWDGFLLFWYSMAIGSLLYGKINGSMVLMLLFPSLHLLVGVGITYAVLATFINRTEVKLSNGELSVYLGPLPFWGNKRVSIHEVSQLFISEQCHQRKRGCGYSYNLNALLTSGERMALVSNFQEPAEALYLERVLEERLRIGDRRVPGDWIG